MNFIVADTFTKSLSQLDPQWQGPVKEAAFEFQLNPSSPGFKFHRVEKARDPNFWSCRVNQDIRLIVYRKDENFILCYADHHDAAYQWAENRRLSTHDTTGALQIVEVIETKQEVVRKVYKKVEEEPPLFGGRYEDDYLLALGVPPEWLDPVKTVGESELYEVLESLPEEASERLLKLACGEPVPRPVAVKDNPLAHPDTLRRFRLMDNEKELRQALGSPLEKWIVFLHPSQRSAVEKSYSGPARISGSAGTGKTVVALHRAAFLAKNYPERRTLLTTFSRTLAARLTHHLKLLMGDSFEESENLTVDHLHRLAHQFWLDRGNKFVPASGAEVTHLMRSAIPQTGNFDFTEGFVRSEWDAVVDANGITTWEEYRNIPRTGRGTPLGVRQRLALWKVFESVLAELDSEGKMTWNQLCSRVATLLQNEETRPFHHVIVDESQDFGPVELRLLRSLVPPGANDLFLCGDAGQRIYRLPYSWAAVGIDTRGRASHLKVNYRTTEQIRKFADSLLPSVIEEEDGDSETRLAVSLLNGREPEIRGFLSVEEEAEAVAAWISNLLNEGFCPAEIAIFARTSSILNKRAALTLDILGLPGHELQDEEQTASDRISIGTMHRAKGLEFKAVVVMGCDRRVLPLDFLLRNIEDEVDRRIFIQQESQLLYVACTRARERLLVTYKGEASSLLEADSIGGVTTP